MVISCVACIHCYVHYYFSVMSTVIKLKVRMYCHIGLQFKVHMSRAHGARLFARNSHNQTRLTTV